MATALAVSSLAGAAHAATTRAGHRGTILVNGKPLFPIVLTPGPPLGATTPWDTDALAETTEAGVNVFRIGSGGTWTSSDLANVLAYDRAAAALGAYTWVNLHGYALATPHSPVDSQLANVVRRVTSDPGGRAIAFWKGRDEPWWSGLSPSKLEFAYCRVTSRGDPAWCHGEPPLGPGPLWVTIEAPRGTAAALADYTPVTDVHGVDEYPLTLKTVPAPGLYQVGQWTSTLAAVSADEPVWTTLQICASGSYDKTTGTFVLPTFTQERYMAYDAIINGARALAFYGGTIAGCWSQTDAQYQWNWTFWQSVLKPLVQELSASSPITPALVNGATSTAVTTSDPTTEAELREGTSPDDLWLLTAYSGPASTPVTFSGLPSWITSGSVYTENRDVTVESGSFTDTFDPWSVHVYHFVEPLTLQPLRRTSAKVRTRVSLYGSGLAGATSVKFGGFAATFEVVSDNHLIATIPTRARSGPVIVRGPTGGAKTTFFGILPSVATAPRIRGSARVGDVLAATAGRWYGDRSRHYRYAWQRCNAHGSACATIPGARRARLALGQSSAGTRLRVVVTVTTAAGSASASSAATPVVRG